MSAQYAIINSMDAKKNTYGSEKQGKNISHIAISIEPTETFRHYASAET